MRRKGLFVVLAVLIVVTGVYASVTASAAVKIHNNTQREATDLHFTVYQKEGWVWIEDWTITQDGFPDQNETPWDHGKGDGKTHAIDVECSGAVIPHCTWVTITAKFTLNKWNTVRFENFRWTFEQGQDSADADVPDHGFAVGYTDPEGNATYWFYNDDSLLSITVKNFQYVLHPTYIPPDSLFDWEGWVGPTLVPFTVPPKDSFAIKLVVPETIQVEMQEGGFLFFDLDLYLYEGEWLVAEETEVHEIQDTIVGVIEGHGSLEPVKLLEVTSAPSGLFEIRYQLPQASKVNLSVYSVAGERFITLVDEQKPAGSYTVRWDGTDDQGNIAPAGLYFCRLSAAGIHAAEKMIRIK